MPDDTSRSRWAIWLRCTAAAAGLWVVAVTQPVLAELSRGPEFFLAHHAGRADVLVVVVWLALGIPLTLGIVLGLSALGGRRSLEVATGIVVGVLVAGIALQISYRLGVLNSTSAAWVAIAAAASGSAAWLTLSAFRLAVVLMSVAVLVVPVTFLSADGVRAVMQSGPAPSAGPKANDLAPIVVVVFDELPLVTLLDEHDKLDAVRYPNFEALAADGVWFRNATTVSDYTRWALPAILSGRLPRARSFPTPVDYPDTLFTLLAGSHRMEVVEPVTSLCPAPLSGAVWGSFWGRQRRMLADIQVLASHVLLPPDARVGLPAINEGWAGFDAREAEFSRAAGRAAGNDVLSTATAFINGIARSDTQPTLYFLHTMLTHRPPRWLPSGQSVSDFTMPPGELPGLVWTADEWPVVLNQQAQLVHAGIADLLIGNLRTRLREAGMYERAMVVVTSDHGLCFRPGDRIRSLTDTNAGEVLPVPLIIKLPSNRRIRAPGSVDDGNVETVDVLPTIADGLGVSIPWETDGTSAFRTGRMRPDKQVWINDNVERRRFATHEIVRLRDAAVRRKVALFGTERWPSPSPPGLASLLGRSVESLTVENPTVAIRVQIDNLFALEDVDPQAPSLPVQAKGRVLAAPADTNHAAVHLAIALNGEIVATTRTWSDTAEWRALLPPERLRRGRNDLDVFIVDPVRPQALLRTAARRPRPVDVDVLFGDIAEFGMTHEGFYHVEHAGDSRFHWTDGAARISLPIDPGHTPTTLSIGVVDAARPGTALRILIDECEVAAVAMPGGPLSTDLDIARCVPNARWMTIRFLSETARPVGRDTRRLGVALSQVKLR